jgi:signal transduction histidine kinase
MLHLFFRSIKTKLTFFINIVIVVICLSVYIYFPNKFEEVQHDALKDKANTLAQIASYNVGESIFYDDIDVTVEQIIPLLKSNEIEYLVIHLTDNSIFYGYNLSEAQYDNYLDCTNSCITSDNTTFKVRAKIEYQSETIGTLYLGYSLSDLNIEVSEMKDNIRLVSLIIFFLGAISVFYIGYVITNPLSKMVEIVEKIRGGDLSIRAPILKNDEIGYLAKSFNSMVNRIEDTNEEMESMNRSLENRVLERTKELNASKDKAETAVRMKTEFLAQMSHEIRTPINSILSYTQLLKDETSDLVPKDLRFSFDMINNGGRRLIRTIDLILNMSELQTGTYEMIIEDCNIVKVLDQLVGEFKTAAKSKNLDLMLINRLDENEVTLPADIYTVTQIFANLIDNAIKYTVSGSIEVVAYKTKENLLSIDVQDTGIGISPKFQETLFEPFTQEEQGYTRKFDGNGLGMALVREYCKLNNAGITVESKKEEGSTFRVVFNKNEIKFDNNLTNSKLNKLLVT